ncbi:NAD(P) transhydrogenase subunit alpha [Membranicola marinus]|uniref:proton-translocating NAD(P)(+) transhydrogenase n=1 Tax=Membranihabitans marinus TaxID=1227546 RepID=A0A953LDY1_9BACT|nr:NAD(P) transhydrogenase subunit alpha [Membranihabitans marinus]MBY5959369.1 NAD(P) transhydrogenase subunit alpha [Membranihabitans marinus]
MEAFNLFVSNHIIEIYVLLLAIFLGFELISRVPTVLHTPLMSGTNAISGVVTLGGVILVRSADSADYLALGLGSLSIVLGMINVVGGYAVTDRMLKMFKKEKK